MSSTRAVLSTSHTLDHSGSMKQANCQRQKLRSSSDTRRHPAACSKFDWDESFQSLGNDPLARYFGYLSDTKNYPNMLFGTTAGRSLPCTQNF